MQLIQANEQTFVFLYEDVCVNLLNFFFVLHATEASWKY